MRSIIGGIGIATNKPALDIQRSVGLKRLLAKRKVRQRDELVVARLGVVEHQTVTIELRHVQAAGRQDAAQHVVGQIGLDIEGRRRHLAAAHAGIHRQNHQLARSRHGDIEQTSPLLERKLQVVVTQAGKCLGGRTRRTDVLHELWRQPQRRAPALKRMLKLLFDVIALHEGPIGKINAVEACRQCHDLRSALDATHLCRTGRFAHAKTLGNRYDRILQTLGRMHGHDAHRAVALLVEGTRGLLARQETVEGQRDGTRRVAEIGLRLGHGVERLEHVGGNGLALGTTLCQTHKPAGGVDHVARDGGERIAAHATKRIPQHLAGARHERQALQARHIGIAHDARIDVTTRGLPRLAIELGRQRQELLGAERKHRRGEQRHKALRRIDRIGECTNQGAHRLHLGCLGKDRAARDDAVEPLVAEGLCVDVGIGHAPQQQHHIALGLPRFDERLETLGNRTSFRLRSLLRAATGNEDRLAARRLCLELVLAFVARFKIQEPLHQTTGVAVKDARHIAQHLVVTAEVAYKLNELAGGGIGCDSCLGRSRGAHLALLATEHLNLGATEAVDRLLRIAHGAQRALPRARQVTDQIDLHLIGILELIDHDHLKAALVGGSDGRIIAQRLVCHAQQIVIVERGLVSLERTVFRLYGTGKPRQRIKCRATASQHNIDERVGSLCLEQLDILFWEHLTRARHTARHHKPRHICHGLAARLERVDGLERHLRLFGRRLARAERRAIGVCQGRGIGTATNHAHVVHAARQLARQLQ